MPSKHGPKVNTFYHSKQWKKVRAQVLARDKYLCVFCGKPGDTVDHIVELDEKNVDNPFIAIGLGNLRTLCRTCHERRHFMKDQGGLQDGVTIDEFGNVSINADVFDGRLEGSPPGVPDKN